MNGKAITQRLKIWMLPIAMVVGIIFHDYMNLVAPLAPWLLAVMLFQTYCRINLKEFRLTRFSLILILVQIIGGITFYFAFLPLGDIVAQAAFICVFCPTATAAPVVTGMLGGSVGQVAAFSLVSNFSVAVLAPFLFTWMGATDLHVGLSFLHTTGLISLKVVPLILGPLVAALLLNRLSPKVHKKISDHQGISFYLWSFTLIIVVGRSVSYVISHLNENPEEGRVMAAMAGVSLIACLMQFAVGRKVGEKFGDNVAGAQSLGQKNTILSIWMAQSFLNPLASVGPATYVAWQNTVNSMQILKKERGKAKATAT